jgi:predicted ATPase
VQHLASGKALELDSDVTFFVGENGSGKSTVIEAIAVASGFNAEGGSKNFSFSTRDAATGLADCLTLSKAAHPQDGYFFRAESFFNAASYIEDIGVSGYGDRPLHEQSHGEGFLALVQNRFRGDGLYILDEPEAALSPGHQLSLLSEIDWLARHNSQLIIATHSPILLTYPGAAVLEFSESGIHRIAYHEYQGYRLYKDFLDDPERMLRHLLASSGEALGA